MKKAIIYLIIFLGIQAVAGLIVPAVWKLATGSSDVTAASMITTTVVFSILAITLFLITRWAEVSPKWLRTRPWSVMLWSVITALGMIVPSVWMAEQMPDLPNIVEQEFTTLLSNRWGYITIGLLAPIAEEVVFRGAILRSLLKWNQNCWIGIAISAALFALSHMNPAQMPHAFLAGLLLGWMYYRTGSIIPGVAFHWVNNSVAYVVYNLSKAAYGTADLKLAELIGEQRVLLAVVFSLCMLLPAIYQLNMRMKK